MGKCTFCGQSAGLLRSQHKECAALNAQSQDKVRQAVAQCIQTGGDASCITSSVLTLARQGFVPAKSLNDLLVDGWAIAMETFLEDGLLSPDEEARLMDFIQKTGIGPKLQQHPSYSMLAKAAQLRDLAQGNLQSRMNFSGSLPVNLMKGEIPIWVFHGTEYLEDRERREFVGRSQGVSIRVMKGVYYRVGSFKGQPVTHQERISLGIGSLYVTNKNLYFAGSQKSVRIPYGKIISFEQFSNGIGVMRDLATAKPQIFITNDGWFTFNLITQISQL